MTIKKAIQKSIEGGWKTPKEFKFYRGKGEIKVISEASTGVKENDLSIPLSAIFLDSDFWQCLFGDERVARVEAKRFIGHLFDDKSAEEYFKTIK